MSALYPLSQWRLQRYLTTVSAVSSVSSLVEDGSLGSSTLSFALWKLRNYIKTSLNGLIITFRTYNYGFSRLNVWWIVYLINKMKLFRNIVRLFSYTCLHTLHPGYNSPEIPFLIWRKSHDGEHNVCFYTRFSEESAGFLSEQSQNNTNNDEDKYALQTLPAHSVKGTGVISFIWNFTSKGQIRRV